MSELHPRLESALLRLAELPAERLDQIIALIEQLHSQTCCHCNQKAAVTLCQNCKTFLCLDCAIPVEGGFAARDCSLKSIGQPLVAVSSEVLERVAHLLRTLFKGTSHSAVLDDIRFCVAELVSSGYSANFDFPGQVEILTVADFERRFGQPAPQAGQKNSFYIPYPAKSVETTLIMVKVYHPEDGINVFIPCLSQQEVEQARTRLLQGGYIGVAVVEKTKIDE